MYFLLKIGDVPLLCLVCQEDTLLGTDTSPISFGTFESMILFLFRVEWDIMLSLLGGPFLFTLPETNIAPEKKYIFKPFILRCYVSFREDTSPSHSYVFFLNLLHPPTHTNCPKLRTHTTQQSTNETIQNESIHRYTLPETNIAASPHLKMDV